MTAEGELLTSIATFVNALAVILIYWLMSRSQGNTDERMHQFKIDALQGFKGIALALVSKVLPLEVFDDKLPKELPEPKADIDILEYITGLIEAGFETYEKTKPEPLPDGSLEKLMSLTKDSPLKEAKNHSMISDEIALLAKESTVKPPVNKPLP